ncbi:hypothetical protein, partial [Jatrophihabitans sp.]|uniref:hypothetical protein n=1 Tax=Jatrophihabitans sp. TaxID=1932789 RepID=UPI0030C77C64|nr:Phage-related minor tail protein [Jatrophihabitans sp.]
AGSSGGGPVTGRSILADEATQLANARALVANEKILQNRGLSKSFIEQLAEKGPAGAATSVSALLHLSKSQIHDLDTRYTQLGQVGGQLGTLAAGDKYGASVTSAQANVNKLIAEEKSIQTQMLKAVTAIADQDVSVKVYLDGAELRATVTKEVSSIAKSLHLQTGKG